MAHLLELYVHQKRSCQWKLKWTDTSVTKANFTVTEMPTHHRLHRLGCSSKYIFIRYTLPEVTVFFESLRASCGFDKLNTMLSFRYWAHFLVRLALIQHWLSYLTVLISFPKRILFKTILSLPLLCCRS